MRAAGICRLISSRWRLRSRLRPPHGRVTLRNSSIIEMGFTTRQWRWSRKKGWARSCSKAAISTNLLQTSSKSAHEYRRYAWEVGYGSDIAATHDEHFVCCEIETQQAAAPSVRGNWRAIIVWYLSNHQSEGENIKKKKCSHVKPLSSLKKSFGMGRHVEETLGLSRLTHSRINTTR